MVNHRPYRQFAPIARRIAIATIVMNMFVISGDLFASNYFAPAKMVDRELAAIAADYYENYLYDQFFMSLLPQDREAEFRKYPEVGLAPTYLRQLLNYDNGRHADSAPVFRYKDYTCDTNLTNVVFYPHEPFGKKDYTVKYRLSCGKNML